MMTQFIHFFIAFDYLSFLVRMLSAFGFGWYGMKLYHAVKYLMADLEGSEAE